MVLTHAQIWSAIDKLAARRGLSASGLARKAGLDATAFNPSKRITAGRPRWPSTESIARILEATSTRFDEFVTLVEGEKGAARRQVPLLGFAQAGAGGYFDDGGFPVGMGWDEVSFPSPIDGPIYALEISGDSMLPLYRDGDVIIVAPGEQVRKGDRVVVKTVSGEVTAKILARRTAKTVELHSLNPEHPPRVLAPSEIDWMARIVWASQ